jgi:hypothetical protein
MHISGLAAVATLIAFAAPAEAKGATELLITGVGLDRPIVLDIDDGSTVGMIAEATRLFDVAIVASGADGGAPMTVDDRGSTPDLGPRLRLTWTVPLDGDGEKARFVQYLYLYAGGGPLLFIPTGQSVYDGVTAGGWYRGRAGLVDALQGVGVPAEHELRAARDAVNARGLTAAGRIGPS